MLFVRLFVLALLLHENTGLFTRGRNYFTTCFLPSLGLYLPPRGMVALHGSLLALCATLLFCPSLWMLYPLLLLALSLLIASYSIRLSNHLVAAWFMGLLLCLDLLFQTPERRGLAPTPFFLSGVQIVVGLTYALAFLHKLNPEYLSPRMSCGSYLGSQYLEHRVNIRHPGLLKLQGFLSIYAILALEGGIPLLFLFPATRPLGVLLAVLLHLPLGLLVHVHFAAVMYAGLSAFVAPGNWPRVLSAAFHFSPGKWVFCLLLGLYLGHRFGGYGYSDRRRLPAYLHQLFFGVYFLAALAVGLTLLHGGPLRTFAWGGPVQRALLLSLTLAFLLNGLSPYIGLKTNFSFAMFSNLRPDPWRHLLWRAGWRPLCLARYIRVEEIEGLPEAVSGEMPRLVVDRLRQHDQWQYTDYFFHEGLRLLCRTAQPPVIRIVYTEEGHRHEVQDYARAMAAHPPRYLRLALFPYTLPLDPAIRHCD